jgi:hypothetical protein
VDIGAMEEAPLEYALATPAEAEVPAEVEAPAGA